MSRISLVKLGLLKKQETKTVQINNAEVEVLQYLEVSVKSSLVNAAVRGAIMDRVVDEILLDAFLHMFIVEHYTNISFTPKQKENILDTFDILESNGVFDLVIATMPPEEYDYIFSMAKKLMIRLNELNQSIVSVIGDADEVMAKLAGQTK